MGDQSAIEWTEATWNPIVGCSRVSEGCRHCYAERQAYRAEAMGIPQYEGMTHKVGSEIRWTGKVALVESALELPLKWKKPRRIFVNSMSDLFHEKVPDEWIDRIATVMVEASQHTFQVLTKRPERMLAYLAGRKHLIDTVENRPVEWPSRNIWWGVSVEDQATADARIPLLLQTPAAMRWVSYEPALGPVFFPTVHVFGGREWTGPKIDWIVIGGESGPGARPFDLAWARQTIAQCRRSSTPVFVKQIGLSPYSTTEEPLFRAKLLLPRTEVEAARFYPTDPLGDRKGGRLGDWPADLRVREYPTPPTERGASR
jgi:protein gp37